MQQKISFLESASSDTRNPMPTSPDQQLVAYFRRRRLGPESELEDKVAVHLHRLFGKKTSFPTWTGGSVPIGAGIPDLVFIEFIPEVLTLSNLSIGASEILAYLRAVDSAATDQITRISSHSKKHIEALLADLERQLIVKRRGNLYKLNNPWKAALKKVITIEVKVADWRKAISQAVRNRIFSHQSYIALPEQTALRVKELHHFPSLGVGLLSIDPQGSISRIISAQSGQPSTWHYYYKLAEYLARSQ